MQRHCQQTNETRKKRKKSQGCHINVKIFYKIIYHINVLTNISMSVIFNANIIDLKVTRLLKCKILKAKMEKGLSDLFLESRRLVKAGSSWQTSPSGAAC